VLLYETAFASQVGTTEIACSKSELRVGLMAPGALYTALLLPTMARNYEGLVINSRQCNVAQIAAIATQVCFDDHVSARSHFRPRCTDAE